MFAGALMSCEDPKVTVLMSVYNGQKHLREAIDSILNQTFKDFEFIIIDDGSTDSSANIIESYKDKRIRFIRNEKNLGVPTSSNKGLRLAHGEYIARMDCDDISLPNRLERQVRFMNANPDVGVCGTWVKYFGKEKGIWASPTNHQEIMAYSLFKSPMVNPTTMIRRELIFNNRLFYDESFKYASDYEFWVRCKKYFSLANLNEILLYYRLHVDQIGDRHRKEQDAYAELILLKQLSELGLNPDSRDIEIYRSLASRNFRAQKNFVEGANKSLIKIKIKNDEIKKYPEPAFSRMLAQKWLDVCNNSTSLGVWTWKSFWSSPLSKYTTIDSRRRVVFAIKCALNYKN